MDTSNDLAITIAVQDDRATVGFAGELDIASASALADSAEALVDQRLTCAVIDLDLITFIDCSGLDRLIAYRARLEASNIPVTFVNPNPAVLKLLRLTGLETTLLDGTAGLATQSTSDR